MHRPILQNNPFDLTKASDFSDSEIVEQWVDLTDGTGGLVKILKPTLRMPMLLLGGKGTGKTHLMRYCSAPAQAKRHGGNLQSAVENDGYVGIYIRADALNTDKFAQRGEANAYWMTIFCMYFELWIATALIDFFTEYVSIGGTDFDERNFADKVADLFDIDVHEKFHDIAGLNKYLSLLRKKIDFDINNSLLKGVRPEIEIPFSAGRLVFGIPEIMHSQCSKFEKVLVVYLIDEVENFTIEQQKFLNSLIRYRRGNATIKLGARLYGIKTYDTMGAGEPIKRDAEYERVELDNLLRNQPKEYLGFVNRLVSRRLELYGVVARRNDTSVYSYFEELDSRDYWIMVQDDLLKGREGQIRPFHEKLRRDLQSVFDSVDVERIITAISVSEHVYLDKAATFYFRKNWPENINVALKLAESAALQARALARGDKVIGADLNKLISHFGSDILAQLYHDYQRRVPYAGFRTLVDLSQGIVRNLLVNLKHIYRRSQFAGEQPFTPGGLISVKSQSEGVRDGAAWFWEDAQPPSGGLQVRDAVESLAVLFRTVRLSHAPAECDLCTFSVSAEGLTTNSQLTLEIAENWSYLLRLSEGRKNKNSRSVDDKYQLAPMLSPRWEVSEHRRGSVELHSELANAILDPEHRKKLPTLLRKRLSRMLSPGNEKKGSLI